jgi:hypothetical protein
VTQILKKERIYDHDNVGKNAEILDPQDPRRWNAGKGGKGGGGASAGEQELALEEEAAAAAAEGGERGGGAGAGGGEAAAEKEEEEGGLDAPALGAAPQVIGVPSKPKYASFRGFASAVWGFSS